MYRPLRDSDGAGRHDVDVSGNLFVVFTLSRASVPTFAVRPVRLQVQHFALEVRRPVPQAISSELTHREYTLKEHSPTRNQLPLKTHDKTQKTQNL